jgi:diadenosine tetraphosphate (Ap4A) HIT family hydrolase
MSPCIFCSIATSRAPASFIHESDLTLAFLDIYPMRPGHALVIPRRHAVRLAELTTAERDDIFAIATRIGSALRTSLGCDDVNLVVNDGAAANQTVPHVHAHLVPRRRGDLPIVLGKLLRRPLEPLLGGPPRAVLDRQASAIRDSLAAQP